MAALELLQREKAQAAAAEVSRCVADVPRSLEWVTVGAPAGADEFELRRLKFLRLLRQEPVITTATLVDAAGREQLHVSRITPDRIASAVDLFIAAHGGRTDLGNVYFVAETEPYLTIAVPSAARDGSVRILRHLRVNCGADRCL